jgi:hypothetical protein
MPCIASTAGSRRRYLSNDQLPYRRFSVFGLFGLLLDMGGESVMLTEAEARKKICPASFSRPDDRAPDGTGIMQGGPWNCYASECMAWRWRDPTNPYSEDRAEHGGFCGLAGRPS